ncbi:MAG: 50S ribosomal protein P1 [Nanoarchaeota archaeon]|nr:50S ribosomal protein P1 [Nanoarchaeota archaeon]MEC8339308.1 50S ribosomal protein P1 [Nanoarchaeota archaeon]
MEYIYAVMLLNKAGKDVSEDNIVAVLKAAGVEADAAKAKSVVAALEGVDIEQVIAESSVAVAAPAAAAPAADSGAAAPAKEEKKEEAAPAADAAAGLGSLF